MKGETISKATNSEVVNASHDNNQSQLSEKWKEKLAIEVAQNYCNYHQRSLKPPSYKLNGL
jgi:hypothetical protein